jgi:hypothetical protein
MVRKPESIPAPSITGRRNRSEKVRQAVNKRAAAANMGRLAVILPALAVLLAMSSLALADEETNYNLATAQINQEIQIVPGDEGQGVIYFYNIDGNRITHVTLHVSETPDSWGVEVQPPQHEIEVEIGGTIVTATENLHVEPSEVLSEEAEDVLERMVCIPVPGRGYALARPAYVIIRVPDSEQIGTSEQIVISAEAEWLGQTGVAAIKQSRDFEFCVEVVSEATDYAETIPNEDEDSGLSVIVWLPATIAAVIVILGALLIPRLVARGRE